MTSDKREVEGSEFLSALGAERFWLVLRRWKRVIDGCGIVQDKRGREVVAIGHDRFASITRDSNGRPYREQVMPHIGPLSTAEILSRLSEWRRANASRCDLFIRIADVPTPAVLIDDVSAQALSRLREEITPRAIVESSPRNFQVWIAVPSTVDPLTLARGLMRRYCGDPGGVGDSQPGRLPGLANRKPSRARGDGLGPWINLIEACPGASAPVGALLHEILAQSASRAAAPRGGARPLAGKAQLDEEAPGASEPNVNDSRRDDSASAEDMRLACKMAWRGCTVDSIRPVILERAMARGKRTPQQYALLTAQNATAYVNAQKWRRNQS